MYVGPKGSTRARSVPKSRTGPWPEPIKPTHSQKNPFILAFVLTSNKHPHTVKNLFRRCQQCRKKIQARTFP